jgi:hypothetical protein
MSDSEQQVGTIVDTCRTDELEGNAMETSQLDAPQDAATAVTLWFRTNEKGEWMMNHLEDGHCL